MSQSVDLHGYRVNYTSTDTSTSFSVVCEDELDDDVAFTCEIDWQGCMNFRTECHHFCGPEYIEPFTKVLTELWPIALKAMNRKEFC